MQAIRIIFRLILLFAFIFQIPAGAVGSVRASSMEIGESSRDIPLPDVDAGFDSLGQGFDSLSDGFGEEMMPVQPCGEVDPDLAIDPDSMAGCGDFPEAESKEDLNEVSIQKLKVASGEELKAEQNILSEEEPVDEFDDGNPVSAAFWIVPFAAILAVLVFRTLLR